MEIVKQYIDDNQYYKEVFPKEQIYLHHTVSSNVDSAINWWNETPYKIATAYIIDKDGTIYETFPPEYWAYHLGISSQYDKKSIGIEFVNEGFLTKRNDKFYWLNDRNLYRGNVHEESWREQSYWAEYTFDQFYSGVKLVSHLIDKFNIKKELMTNLNYDESLLDFEGILSHCNVRKDKTDISVAWKMDLFRKMLFPDENTINNIDDIKSIYKTGE